MDEESALELLRTSHTFPGPFTFRVVVRSGGRPAVEVGMATLADDGLTVTTIDERQSRKGNYISCRVTCHVDSPEAVIAGYAVLNGLDEVLMTL